MKLIHPTTYRALRKSVGSQATVAALLGVHVQTIKRRELGLLEIGVEASLALQWLAANKKAER